MMDITTLFFRLQPEIFLGREIPLETSMLIPCKSTTGGPKRKPTDYKPPNPLTKSDCKAHLREYGFMDLDFLVPPKSILRYFSNSFLNEFPSAAMLIREFRMSVRKVEMQMCRGFSQERLNPGYIHVLGAPNGTMVYLVGTNSMAHISRIDVALTIKTTRPKCVVLGLCKERFTYYLNMQRKFSDGYNILNYEYLEILSTPLFQLLYEFYNLFRSRNDLLLTEEFGYSPGGEVLVAASEVMKIPECELVFGGVPLEVSNKRLGALFTFPQRLKFIWYFIRSCFTKNLVSVKKLQKNAEPEAIYQRVLIDEQDVYFTHKLFKAATLGDNKGRPVVGVVDMAHVPGILGTC